MAWYISWYDFMCEDLDLKGCELLVYAVIHGFTKSKGKFSGSLKTLEEYTRFDKRHCFRAVKKLEEKGYVIKKTISHCKVEYIAVYIDGLNIDGKAAAKPSNLITDCETMAVVSNPITDENKSICDEMDAINDKPPNQPTEYGNKMLAKIKASIQK